MVGTIAGVLLATVLNNGGGAWDNAKKYIESGNLKDDDGNVLGKGTRRPRGGRRRRHGRRSVQGHRRPVAPRPREAAGDDHAGARAALHPLAARRARPAAAAAACPWMTAPPGRRHRDRAGAHGVPAGLVVGAPDRRPARCSAGTTRSSTAPRSSVMLHLGTLVALLRLLLARPAAAAPGRARRAPRPLASRATPIGGWPGCSPSSIVPGRRSSACRSRGPHRHRLPRAARARRGHCSSPGRRCCGWQSASGRARPRIWTDLHVPRRRRHRRRAGARPVPGHQPLRHHRSAAGLFAGLDREAAARFAFLMGMPIIAGAGLWKLARDPRRRGGRRPAASCRCSAGMVAVAHRRACSRSRVLLRYLRSHGDGHLHRLPDRARGVVVVAWLAACGVTRRARWR